VLGIPVRTTHRALEDAQTTRQVFLRLYQVALELPFSLILQVQRLGGEIEWGAGPVFDYLAEELKQSLELEGSPPTRLYDYFPPLKRTNEPLTPLDETVPLNVEELASVLEPGGPFAQNFSAYEHRTQQIAMLRAIAESFSRGRHLLVEAGTGTGKSMAYLIPTFAWAAENGHRVVISTNTINLQDQLIHKDIPDLRHIVNTEYKAAVLKGRSNYLCPRRLLGLLQIGARSGDEVRLLAKVLVWLHQGGQGDRAEINLFHRERAMWSRLSAEGDDCSLEACLEYVSGGCPYYKARVAAEDAHAVIVNHALLLADITTGNRVIPEYKYLILDEAHHLEEATTKGLSFEVNQREVMFLLRDLTVRTGGLLGGILEIARNELPEVHTANLEEVLSTISSRAQECGQLAERTFDALEEFMHERRDGKPLGPYGQQVRIEPSTRKLPEWSKIEITWEDLRGPLGSVAKRITEISEELEDLVGSGTETAANIAIATRIVARDLNEIYTNLDRMIFEPDPQIIYWLNARFGQENITMHAAPLEVGSLVERYLWHEKESIVMTSATLTTSGEFDYIRRRLNANEADELVLGSPFDYETSTLLYLVTDIAEPTQRQEYQRSVEQGLIGLTRETAGRTMVLFTSNEQLRRTAQAIEEPLSRDDIQVFTQGSGASRHALLEGFRTTEQAVLLGTRSFWEGIDVPGEALSVLVIVRLPFSVPSDPIVAARSETYDSPFNEYMVPEAVLRFRQGFGRLIRTKSDRGVVAIFDRRIRSKSYGQTFLMSLPHCTVREGSLANLPTAAARWLGV
jgi:DNA polymerase-3 subunit epsilon/ATP-dependent DNA helicase DinG